MNGNYRCWLAVERPRVETGIVGGADESHMHTVLKALGGLLGQEVT